MTRHPLALKVSVGVYRALLLLYPASFTNEFGGPMVQAFRDLAADAEAEGGLLGLTGVWSGVVWDMVRSAAEQHRATGVGRPGGWTVASLLPGLPAIAFWASVFLDSCVESRADRWLVDAQALIPPAGQASLWLALPALGLGAAVHAARLDGRSALSIGGVGVNTFLVVLVLAAATLRVS